MEPDWKWNSSIYPSEDKDDSQAKGSNPRFFCLRRFVLFDGSVVGGNYKSVSPSQELAVFLLQAVRSFMWVSRCSLNLSSSRNCALQKAQVWFVLGKCCFTLGDNALAMSKFMLMSYTLHSEDFSVFATSCRFPESVLKTRRLTYRQPRHAVLSTRDRDIGAKAGVNRCFVRLSKANCLMSLSHWSEFPEPESPEAQSCHVEILEWRWLTYSVSSS